MLTRADDVAWTLPLDCIVFIPEFAELKAAQIEAFIKDVGYALQELPKDLYAEGGIGTIFLVPRPKPNLGTFSTSKKYLYHHQRVPDTPYFFSLVMYHHHTHVKVFQIGAETVFLRKRYNKTNKGSLLKNTVLAGHVLG